MRTILLLLTLSLCSCNLIEGIRQFNPNYNNPTPFSDVWWKAKKDKSIP